VIQVLPGCDITHFPHHMHECVQHVVGAGLGHLTKLGWTLCGCCAGDIWAWQTGQSGCMHVVHLAECAVLCVKATLSCNLFSTLQSEVKCSAAYPGQQEGGMIGAVGRATAQERTVYRHNPASCSSCHRTKAAAVVTWNLHYYQGCMHSMHEIHCKFSVWATLGMEPPFLWVL
jgi:hypothetical protein